MRDPMTAAAEARKQREKEVADSDKRRAMREIFRTCATEYEQLKPLDMVDGEGERVNPDGSCAFILTVDMSKLQHPHKKKVAENKALFYGVMSVMKDVFTEMAPRKKITPFSFIVQGRDGQIVTRVDVPSVAP